MTHRIKILTAFLLGTLVFTCLAAMVPQATQDIFTRVANLETAVWTGQTVANGLPGGVPNLSSPIFTNPIITSTAYDSTAYCAIPIGSVAYASVGTAASGVTGSLYTINVSIPKNVTLHGYEPLWGATVGTNLVNVALYNSSGVLLANSATAGTASTGASTFQQIPFTANVSANGPAKYIVGIQLNGTADFYRGVAASTFLNTLAGSSTGTFGVIPATITPGTASTGGVIGCLY
jgi:hypothetical protein